MTTPATRQPRLPTPPKDRLPDRQPRSAPSNGRLSGSFAALLREARAGESEAAGDLLERFIRYLGWVSEQETDPRLRAKEGLSDVVQDTLLDAYLALDGFQGSSPQGFAGWLRRVLRNNLADRARRYYETEMRKLAREVRLVDLNLGDPSIASDDTPSRLVMRGERDAGLASALDSLPERYRRAIDLRHRHGLSFAEVGERMDLSGEAARKLWCRAVRGLQRALEVEDHVGAV